MGTLNFPPINFRSFNIWNPTNLNNGNDLISLKKIKRDFDGKFNNQLNP
jgi:hypothetical protein